MKSSLLPWLGFRFIFYKQHPCIISLVMISFLFVTQLTYARTDRHHHSLVSCADNCIRQTDCNYFVFDRITHECGYGPSATAATPDKSDTKGTWIKIRLGSQSSENQKTDILKWSFELIDNNCARPKYLPDVSRTLHPKLPIRFVVMDCFRTFLINSGDSIRCYNKGSWDIIANRCYQQIGSVMARYVKIRVRGRLRVGSQIKFSGLVINKKKCQINLMTKYRKIALQVKLEFLPNSTAYVFNSYGTGRWEVSENGEVTALKRLDATITISAKMYELRMDSETTLEYKHRGNFRSVYIVIANYEVPFDQIQIIF